MDSDTMTSRLNGLDLSVALRILKNAGRPDPTQLSPDPEVQLQYLIDALCDLSVHDGLTGLVNATFFHTVMGTELDRSSRTGRTCGLLMIDIDHFKTVNDTYGHQVGDRVLQLVARQLKQSLRKMDTAARVGGEEFAVILPECTPEDAIQAATRIHGAVNRFTVEVGDTLTISTSAGLVWTEVRLAVEPSTLISQADRELYRAKDSGRGRLCYPPLTSTEVAADERLALIPHLKEGPDDR